MPSQLRLGFHYHVPAFLRDGCIMMPGYLGCFIDALARECKEVVCFLHAPVGQEEHFADYCVRSSNVRLVNIGPHESVPRRMFNASRSCRPLKEWQSRIDAMLIRGPSPLLPSMALAAPRLPVSLLLVGNAVAGV